MTDIKASSGRIPILDGWRAISILLVLAAHLLPLGPKVLQTNAQAGAMGMTLFFTLSGFLIVSFLGAGVPVGNFLVKRLARIVPLSWVAVAVLLMWNHADLATALRNFLFVANIPPTSLLPGGEHLWSLGVEMQFYMLVAMMCLLFGRRSLYAIPALALGVTIARIAYGQQISIITWFRIDEILAGGTMALVYRGWFGPRAIAILGKPPLWALAAAWAITSHPEAGALQYLRPYASAWLVGASLIAVPNPLRRLLESRPMAYVAEISYALYVIHGVMTHSWLGTGSKLEVYLKRPILIGTTFLLAHVSTRCLEQPVMRAARRLSRSPDRKPVGPECRAELGPS